MNSQKNSTLYLLYLPVSYEHFLLITEAELQKIRFFHNNCEMSELALTQHLQTFSHCPPHYYYYFFHRCT